MTKLRNTALAGIIGVAALTGSACMSTGDMMHHDKDMSKISGVPPTARTADAYVAPKTAPMQATPANSIPECGARMPTPC